MQLVELKQNIINKKLDNFYLFSGEEIKIMDTYIQQIIKTFNLEPIRVDSINNIYSTLRSKSLTSKANCYIISNDLDYIKAEKVWDDIININTQNVIILVYYSLDRRTKFYKHHQEIITEFEKLSNEILLKYIQKEVDLNKEFSEELIDICDNNYNRILLEIDKVKCLAKSKNTTHGNAYNIAIEDKIIYVPVKDMLFPFIDAVNFGNIILSYEIWNMIRNQESSMAILSLLYTSFRSILSLQYAGSVQGICAYTGLTPWQIKLAKPKINIFDTGQLIEIIKLIRWIEKGIKSGLIEEDISIDYLLTQIFSFKIKRSF